MDSGAVLESSFLLAGDVELSISYELAPGCEMWLTMWDEQIDLKPTGIQVATLRKTGSTVVYKIGAEAPVFLQLNSGQKDKSTSIRIHLDRRGPVRPKMELLVTGIAVRTGDPSSSRPTPPSAEVVANKSTRKETVVREDEKEITNSIGMKLNLIPAGKFTMGSPREERDRSEEEHQHEVEITRPFYMGVYEVTQKQYRQVMGANPSSFSKDGSYKDQVRGKDTDHFPVENVSWQDATDFCKKLSARPAEKKKGLKYRLPSEAEWEYACRGGTRSYQVFHFGNSLSSRQANFNGHSPYGRAARGPAPWRTCKVGLYRPNGFGLYDMHGNVWEWCSDWYDKDYYAKSPPRDPQGPSTGSLRVIRGGAWHFDGRICRSANRSLIGPGARGCSLGFRVAAVPSGK
jgi:formylglycine-generating enzyme required for sulfatase activity